MIEWNESFSWRHYRCIIGRMSMRRKADILLVNDSVESELSTLSLRKKNCTSNHSRVIITDRQFHLFD